MNIKKIILLFILLIPYLVNAETCNDNDVIITSIEKSKVTGNVEENIEPVLEGKKLDLDLNFFLPGDEIEYKINIKNSSNKDYYMNGESTNLNSNYIDYEFLYDDNLGIIKADTEQTILLKIKYKNKVPVSLLENESFSESNSVVINFSNANNPDTGSSIRIISILLLVLIGILLFVGTKKVKKLAIIVLLVVSVATVHALCSCEITIETKVQIDGKEAKFLPGSDFNLKIKQLASNEIITEGKTTVDTNITAFLYSPEEPSAANKENKNIASSNDSDYPIYMWYDEGTIYWWSEDKTPYTNEDSSNMFTLLSNLTDISSFNHFDTSKTTSMEYMLGSYDSLNTMHIKSLEALEKWDVSNVENMRALFYLNVDLIDISPLANWDTSKVKNMNGLFGGLEQYTMHIKSLEPLRNWNTSSLETMKSMFRFNVDLESLSGLENWDTSNVVLMSGLFYGKRAVPMHIKSLEPLRNWNTSKVTNMDIMFQSNVDLTDLSPIANWDTSNVKDMSYMFNNVRSLTSIEPLRNWNTSNVTSMMYLFQDLNQLTSLSGLENWDTSNVIQMNDMFHNCINLEDASAISNWDVSSVETMSAMFKTSDGDGTKNYSTLPRLDISNWNMANVKNYNSFLEDLRYVETEFTIRNTNIEDFGRMLLRTSNKSGHVKINYTAETESIVDQMLTTASSGASVEKGDLVE